VTARVEPILYSFRRCPYAMRARLALVASGVRCRLREVKLSAKPQAMLDASPKGTVPVLVLPDGTVIDQSLEIMHWALATSDPAGWLERDDPALIAANDGLFKQHLDGYKYPDRLGTDASACRAQGLAILRALDGRLAIAGQLCGARPGLADAAILPFVRQFAAVDQAWFDDQALPHLHAWLRAHLASAPFAAVMMRVAPWSPGDAEPFFPAADGFAAAS
jgi:glutathione S-transferase